VRHRFNATITAARAYAPALMKRSAPPVRFVVLTTGRTGSELLVSLLNSHRAITCDGELLAEPRSFPRRYVTARAAVAGLRGADAHGWKLLSGQFRHLRGIGEPLDYPRRLHETGSRIILLERRNIVQQTLSWMRTGHGNSQALAKHHYTVGESREVGPMAIDPLELLAGTYYVEAEATFVREAAGRVPHLRLVYEDDLCNPVSQQATVDRICSYLGLPPAPVASKLIRITPRRVRDMLSNFDEIEALVSQTRYRKYLLDDD
jgi:hypothetical protein